jgi:assimilatory nitrate reductase catalytic subunit
MRIEAEMRINVLAGGSAAQNAAGRTICVCFGIGLSTLHETITSHRLTEVTEISAVLRAGTNCGSCIPELKAILSTRMHEATLA